MVRGVAALVGVACLFVCAPGWASAAAGNVWPAVRLTARTQSAPQLKMPLGSLALRNSYSVTSAAELVSRVRRTRPKARLSITPGTLSYRGGLVKFAISASHATRCALSSKPRFFAGPNARRVKCRGKMTLTLPAVDLGLHWSFKFTARNARGQVSVATRKLVLQKPPFAISSNW